jgi:hypothetical protein
MANLPLNSMQESPYPFDGSMVAQVKGTWLKAMELVILSWKDTEVSCVDKLVFYSLSIDFFSTEYTDESDEKMKLIIAEEIPVH